MTTTLTDVLWRSLSERWRPEQVAKAIVEARSGAYAGAQLTLLRKALPRWEWSSMPTAFQGACGMARQCETAAKLFGVSEPRPEPGPVRRFIDRLRARLGATRGLDFKADRLSRRTRVRRGLTRSHRAYNKRFRILARLEEKLRVWGEVGEVGELARVAKSRLAFRITRVAMNEPETACFLAWMVARLNVRSMFTFGRQERAFDEVAEMLLSRVPRRRAASWWAVALVHPAPDVLARLSEARRGRLLGEWWAVMRRAASVLERVAKRDKPNLNTLIVRRGNDSSTWNAAAGAFNKARDGWVATLHALGMESALDSVAPGKALRLMAADVAYGHRVHGEGLDPDTAVWNALPMPWDVVAGRRRCNRARIEKACGEVGTPHGGWIAPRSQRATAYRPTPELVRGVVCADPTLATILRKAGYFGGHGHRAKTRVDVSRPFDGATVGAAWPEW